MCTDAAAEAVKKYGVGICGSRQEVGELPNSFLFLSMCIESIVVVIKFIVSKNVPILLDCAFEFLL